MQQKEKNMQKTALVLEGGAKRGIYTAGVLDVFLENNIHFDYVIGTSAGGVHGCSYVSKQNGRSIRYNIKYGKDYRFMSFKSWLLSGNVVDTAFCYHEIPEKLDPFDNQTFMASDTNFYVVVSNLESGKSECLHCTDMFKQIDYLRASASMPFASQIVNINGKPYLDGGITNSIPLNYAKEFNADKIVVVCTRQEGYRKKTFKLKWLAKLVYGKYPKFIEALLNRYKMYNAQVEGVENLAKQGKIILIRPSSYINISRMEKDLNKVQQMYELGRKDGVEALNKVKQLFS